MKQLQIIKDALQSFLESHPGVSSFYIGKTDDYSRRENEHLSENGDGYAYMWQIAEGEPSSIAEMENQLISHFKTSIFSSKLENKNTGSGGNAEANILYFCVKTIIRDINELGEDFVSLDGVSNPIKLVKI